MMKPAFAKIVTLLAVALTLIVNDEVDGRLENINPMKLVKRFHPPGDPPGGMPPMMGMGGPPQKREVKLEGDQTQLQFVKRFHPFPGGMPMGPAAPPSKRSINDDINNETPFQKRCGGMGAPPQKREIDGENVEEPFVKRCGGGPPMGGPASKRSIDDQVNEGKGVEALVKRHAHNAGGPPSKRSIDDQVNEGKGAEALVKRHAHNAGGPPSKRSIDDQVNEGKGAEALVKRHAHNAGGPPS